MNSLRRDIRSVFEKEVKRNIERFMVQVTIFLGFVGFVAFVAKKFMKIKTHT